MKRQDIVQAIELLTQAARLGANVGDELKRLDLLLSQFDSGDYIEVTPPLNGYGYVTAFYADPHFRPEKRGWAVAT